MTSEMTPSSSGSRGQLWLLREACFLQFVAFGLMLCFETVWMKEHGMGEYFIGRTLSLSTVLVLISGLTCGFLADVTGRPDRIVLLGCLLTAGALFFLTRCREPTDFVIYAVIRGASLPMTWNMMPLLAVSVVEGGAAGKRYSLYRMFGSLGYVLSTVLLSWLISDIRWLLLIAAWTMLLAPVPMLFFRPGPRAEHAHGRIRVILRNRELVALYVAMFFFGLAGPAVYAFTNVYARQLGAPTPFIGLLTGSMGFVALFGLPASGWAVDRFGPRALLLLAFLAQPLRVLSLSLVTRYEYLLLPHVFHFFTFASLDVAAVLFVTRLAGPRSRGTAMSIYAGSRVLAGIAGAPVAGYLAESFSYPTMYRVSGAAAAVGFVVFAAAVAVRRRRQTPDAVHPPGAEQ